MLNERNIQPLDIDELAREFKSHDRLYRSRVLIFKPKHLIRYEKNLTPKDQPPYYVDLFADYFKDTYFSLCQVYGLDLKLFIPNWTLMLCMDI